MKLSDHILLWNHTYIKIMDIRFTMMEQGEAYGPFIANECLFLYKKRRCLVLITIIYAFCMTILYILVA